MKVNWQFLKKPSVIIGAVILFFILLFMLNKGSSGSASSGQTVVNAGPSDAQVAAQTQLAMAQMSAGLQGQAIQLDYAKSQDTNDTQLALATIAATLQGQSLAVQQAIAAQTINAQVHGLDLQYQTALANNNFALSYAHEQFGYMLGSQALNVGLEEHLSDNSLEGYKYGAALAVVPTLKKKDRDNALISIVQDVPYRPTTTFSTNVNMATLTGAGQLA